MNNKVTREQMMLMQKMVQDYEAEAHKAFVAWLNQPNCEDCNMVHCCCKIEE